MRHRTISFAMAILGASSVLGQTPAEANLDRVLHYSHAETAQELQEIATNVGAVAGIRQLSVDVAARTLTLHAPAVPMGLAEWLFNELDQPARSQAPAPQNVTTHEYRLPGDRYDIVRVFYLAHAWTPQRLQEVATTVRSTADIRWTFTCNPQRAITLRGTAAQMALAEFVLAALDKASPPPEPAQPYSAGDDDVVRVFYLAHAAAPQQVQEVATDVRSIADIRRLFTCYALKAITVRGTAEQMGIAAWLIGQLDQPANPPAAQAQSKTVHEYRPPGGGDDLVRVFYMAHTGTPQRLQEIATQVRSMTEVRRLFTYSATPAMVLRGKAEQMTLADRLIKERDR